MKFGCGMVIRIDAWCIYKKARTNSTYFVGANHYSPLRTRQIYSHFVAWIRFIASDTHQSVSPRWGSFILTFYQGLTPLPMGIPSLRDCRSANPEGVKNNIDTGVNPWQKRDNNDESRRDDTKRFGTSAALRERYFCRAVARRG